MPTAKELARSAAASHGGIRRREVTTSGERKQMALYANKVRWSRIQDPDERRKHTEVARAVHVANAALRNKKTAKIAQ